MSKLFLVKVMASADILISLKISAKDEEHAKYNFNYLLKGFDYVRGRTQFQCELIEPTEWVEGNVEVKLLKD